MPLSAARAFKQSSSSSPELPRVPAFHDLYEKLGWRPRVGGYTMVAGVPGAMKSLFTTFWVAQMGLPTLYFAADTSPFDASMRLATMSLRESTEEIEGRVSRGDGAKVDEALNRSNISFSFGSPLSWKAIYEEMDAWVEVNNGLPSVVVLDNLMDFESAESSYEIQMQVTVDVTAFVRQFNVHTVLLHHATDKGFNDLRMPPPRNAIKNGLAEKPEQVITVANDPDTKKFRASLVKNRSGRQDPTAETYATMWAIPGIASFARMGDGE